MTLIFRYGGLKIRGRGKMLLTIFLLFQQCCLPYEIKIKCKNLSSPKAFNLDEVKFRCLVRVDIHTEILVFMMRNAYIIWSFFVNIKLKIKFPEWTLSFTSVNACEKSSQWLWKESCVSTGVRKPGNTCASLTAIWLELLTLHLICKLQTFQFSRK